MFTTAWTARERKALVQMLRDGARPADVVAHFKRTLNAIQQALAEDGQSYRALVNEGRDSRIRAILAAGGGVAEVMVAEGWRERAATRHIARLVNKGDRRRLTRSYTQEEQRRIYLSVREIGIRQTAAALGFTRSTVRRAAIAYRAEVLTNSPPLGRGKPEKPRKRKTARATTPTATTRMEAP